MAKRQNLDDAIREKRFREDLFFRLNVIPIEAPPLRDRREDIPLLAHHFLEIANRERNGEIRGFSQSTLDTLCDYRWPGNVRELENLIERLVVTHAGNGEITPADLPKQFQETPTVSIASPRVPAGGLSFREVVDDFESDLIRQAMEQSRGTKNRAAQLLGLNRTTLLEKIKKKGLYTAEH
jgi:DNA-binding NtrC family response regulator